jgi:hypothetical protein
MLNHYVNVDRRNRKLSPNEDVGCIVLDAVEKCLIYINLQLQVKSKPIDTDINLIDDTNHDKDNIELLKLLISIIDCIPHHYKYIYTTIIDNLHLVVTTIINDNVYSKIVTDIEKV